MKADWSREQNTSQTLSSLSFNEGVAYVFHVNVFASKIPRGINTVLKTKSKLF